MCGLSVNAAVSYEVDQKFTSVEDLADKQFTIVNETEGMAIYNSDNQNLKYDIYATAVTGVCYQFVLESLDDNNDASVHGMYALKCVKTDGTSPNVYGQTPIYLNSGKPDGFNGCFVLGNGTQLGTDFQYGGVWEVNYVEGSGFTLKNKGIGGYFKGVNSRPDATEPVYWTFCTLKEGEEIPDPVIPEPTAPLADGELIPDFFSICGGGGVPYGYNVKFGSEDRAYPTTYGSGSRMFEFGEGGDFTRGLYFREGYVQYGTVKELALEAGTTYTVHFKSAMWKSSGAQMTFEIFKADNLETAVLSQTINNTPNLDGSTAAVSGSTNSQIVFTPETAGNYILKWSVPSFNEVILANVGVREGAAALDISAYTALKAQVEALDDDATIFSGDATVDISAAETAIAAATTVDDVNAACDLLRQAALSFVTSVTVNEGKYFDLTNLWIVNPTVRQNTNGWTITNPSGYPTGWSSNGVTSNNETEFYQNQFDFYQELTLPKGTYEFGVTGFHRAGNHSTYFYAGEDRILIPGVEKSVVDNMSQAEQYFNNGNGKVALKFALENESNTMNIGITNRDTETDRWTIFRDFTLHYYGSAFDYSVYTDRWAELVSEATTAMTTYANVTGAELTDLNSALENAPADGDKKADYIAKIEALEAALNTFNNAGPAYNAYATYKAETEALFGTDLDVAAPTTAAQAITAVQNLNIAQYNKVATDYTFSCSGLIGDFGSWEGTATVAGSDAKPNYLDREHWSGIRHAYYEQAAAGWQNAAGWTIQYKKTCTLPAGDYVIKVAARSSGGTTSNISCSATNETISLPNLGSPGRGINTSGVASWSDDDKFTTGNLDNNQLPSVGGAGTGWQWRFLPFTLSEQTEVTMTFYAEATSQYQWMSIADGELLSKTKLAEDVIYDEGATNIIENKLIADVTIDRKIKADFNTVVLPFDLTANQVAAAFGANTEVYEYSENSTDANNVTVNFTKNDGSIKANTPVLIKATVASNSQTFEGVHVVAPTDPAVSGNFFDFVGVYAPIEAIAAGDYFIGNGALYESKGNTSINAFRAYIKLKENAEARIISFAIDDKATAIEGIEIEGANDGKIYNLKGQEVKNPQKGVYIQNGKIIIIK